MTYLYLGLFSKIRAVVELPVVTFLLIERNLGLEVGAVDEGLSPKELRFKSPVDWEKKKKKKKKKKEMVTILSSIHVPKEQIFLGQHAISGWLPYEDQQFAF